MGHLRFKKLNNFLLAVAAIKKGLYKTAPVLIEI
jgi:hypothetical protein